MLNASSNGWRRSKRGVFANEIVNAKMQRDRCLVRLQVFAIAESLSLKSFQFLANAQKYALDVARGERF